MGANHQKFNFTQLYAYLKSIQQKHKLIKSFAERLNENDAVTDNLKGDNLPGMVVNPPTQPIIDNQSGNTLSNWTVNFEILDLYSSKAKNSADAIKTMINTCREYALDVVSYLREEGNNNILPGFKNETVMGQPVYYVDAGYYGWEITFQVSVPEDLSYKTDKWTD